MIIVVRGMRACRAAVGRGLRLAVLLPVLAACAGGPKLAEMQASIPPIPAGDGRVWFFRSGSPVGAAVQPSIAMDGRKVGDSVPGGFFWVDALPGPHVVTTATETDYSVKFTLAAGEERFVRTVVSMGLLVGRVAPELVDPVEARGDLASKGYTGGK